MLQNRRKCSFFPPPKRRLSLPRIMALLTVSVLFLASYAESLPRHNRHCHSFTIKSHVIRPELAIRGGSTRKPSAKQRARIPRTTREETNDKKHKVTSPTRTKRTYDNSIQSQQHLPVVESLLVPRRLASTQLIQHASTVAVFVCFLACVKTAGRPYAAAVFRTVHGTTSSSHATTHPLPIDEVLARRLADASGDALPPSHLPNAAPLVGVLLSLALYIAATLFPKWFLHINVLMNYEILPENVSREELQEQIRQSRTVLAYVRVPRDERHLDGKSHVLCPLYTVTAIQSNASSDLFYFDLHHKRFYYSYKDKKRQQVTDGGPILHSSVPLVQLTSMSGLTTQSELRQAQEQYSAYNALTLPAPTIMAAFVSRISSPLSVLQLVGKLLSALEEDFKSSCMGLATTLLHHYWNARRSIVSATELSKEVGDTVQNASRETVWALRPSSKKKRPKVCWKKLSAVELVPGDVFVLNNTASIMPVDALLLKGSCVTNEAVLTGESVPQTKVPLQIDDGDEDTCLDMAGTHRHSVLFAGTSLLHCTNTQEATREAEKQHGNIPPPPKACSGAQFLTLRSGSYSSRGELLRALLAQNSNHVGAITNPQTERDALRLISALSCFAALACASLFYGRHKVNTSAFRRVVQCTRIAVASIPSDLPLALSSVAHSCSLRLRNEADVVCSEPGSLLTAAHAEIVVFDKTGTLTADTQALSRVVVPKEGLNDVKRMDEVILAGCHSIVDLDDPSTPEHHFAGDPLDLASLQYAGWTYDRKYDAYHKKKPITKDGPVKLWQINTFPFDATRRTSSALLLVLYADGKCRLWKTIKGSPDIIGSIVDPQHAKWYNKQMRKLGGQGLRTIAMAASEVTSNDDDMVASLFSCGLPDPSNSSDKEFQEMIALARGKAGSLHRSEFEGFENDGTTAATLPAFELVGFACFDATVRPSTRRVVQELKTVHVNVIMLTGDGVDAAMSVADTAGLLSCNDSIAVLDLDGSSASEPTLVWHLLRKKKSKKKKSVSSFELVEVVAMTEQSVASTFKDATKGLSSLAITGKAAEQVLSARDASNNTYSQVRENMHLFSIFARASPKQKRSVVSNLKDHSGMKVLMCGDGVNDVAAMKVADVGAALLNGYGDEGAITKDIEDERRLEELSRRKIGSNRRKTSTKARVVDPLSLAGVGSSASASSARITAEIDKALHEIQKRVKTQQKEGKYSVQQMLHDLKDSFYAIARAVNKERCRKKTLRKGGGAAARILADEDKLRRELVSKAGQKGASAGDDQVAPTSSTIKPGEASLAASFSCLRPAIDGVEGLLRVGIAAAACASTVQQTIALNCILSCYNLATLYRDGFRYGKYLWNVELFFSMAIDQAIYQSSTTARPRLSSVRPEQSLFHPKAALMVCAQAFIHLTTLAVGARTANALEQMYAVPNKHASKVHWKDDISRPSTFASLAKALAAVPRPPKTEEKKRRGLSLLGRPPFTPNYATNIVFFMSILQNAVSAVITHTGKPFYGTILESRQICVWIGASFLFVVAGVTEMLPQANEFLELRPLPSRRYQRSFLALLFIDVLGCFAAKWAIEGFRFSHEEVDFAMGRSQSAADKEELLLAEEAAENKRLLIAMGIAVLVMVVSSFF